MEYRNPGAVIEETIRVRMLKDTFGILGKKQLLIDLGCGPRPYYNLYKSYYERTIGIEHPDTIFPKSNIDIFCTAESVPLESETADVILCTEVLHDIAEPQKVLREINRLLKPGGVLILTTPFLVPIVDGKIDHYRYTKTGLTYLISKSGMKVESVVPVSDIFGALTTLYVKPWLRIWNVIQKKPAGKGFIP
jgi:SAM-dependent methyltransferase